jgi:hypothetical protein
MIYLSGLYQGLRLIREGVHHIIRTSTRLLQQELMQDKYSTKDADDREKHLHESKLHNNEPGEWACSRYVFLSFCLRSSMSFLVIRVPRIASQ